MNDQERMELLYRASRIFTPAVPVSDDALFAGRIETVFKVVDVVNQRGQHVLIFGERGVGKTSLANIISSRLEGTVPVIAPRVNCDTTDDFTSLWKKVLAQIDVIKKKRAPGFQLELYQETIKAAEVAGDRVTPDDARRLCTFLGDAQILIVIFDEFDRLTNRAAKRAIADTVKSFADNDVPATLVIVGVADSVDDLISEHQSIERALVTVPMKRMEPSELDDILNRGTHALGLKITATAKARITLLSQGLPHYTHLLGLHASRIAITADKDTVELEDVAGAIKKAVENTEQGLRTILQKAIWSPQKDNMFSEVLLACAMTPPDEFGYFAAGDIRGPLEIIMGRPYGIPSFARHLNQFCQDSHGAVLKKSGVPRRYRYRFNSPLMQPLIIMKGLMDGRIDPTLLEQATFM